MTAPLAQGAFLFIWVGSIAVAAVAIALAVIWAVRTGQFRDQKHAARLPLESHIPDDEKEDSAPEGEGETKEDENADTAA